MGKAVVDDIAFEAHEAAAARLQASYAAIPADQTVRLAKSTSNLFRPRAATVSSGLDVSDLDGVIAVDAAARTVDVQGMCTYERLVEATLQHGLMPLVVPQLKTITVGGAVSGLGIESSSFRSGLPHESVLELDVLTGDGRLVTATADNEAADLFVAFPNSYGSLGYATRLRIELEPVRELLALHHVRFRDLDAFTDALRRICAKREWHGEPVDFVDGVMFSLDEAYLTLAHWADRPADAGSTAPSDYTGAQIFYRSIRERERDVLVVHDYLWRWDTDWFWCSGAFGAQHPVVRRLWPARWRRSDVYHRLIGLEHRWQIARRLETLRGIGPQERVVQDVEIPVEETADFLRWFGGEVKMSPVWLCPLKLREPGGPGSARQWPLYPLDPGRLYVNVGFWGQVPVSEGRRDGDVNRMVEQSVARHHGHKSLYSDVYYDEATFAAIYGGDTYDDVKQRYDPDHRLTGMWEKAVGRR